MVRIPCIKVAHRTPAITGGPDSDKDGKPGVQEDRRVEHIVPPDAVRSGSYNIYVEVSCNGMFGLGTGGYRYQVPDVSTLSRHEKQKCDP